MRVGERVCGRESGIVRGRVWKRERECLGESVGKRECGRQRECGKESGKTWKRECGRESVCVGERESVWESVCGRES